MLKKLPIDRPTENWTKFPNCILDNLDSLTPVEFKILGFMIRKNIGYKEPNKQFSARYLSLRLNISRSTIQTAVACLLNKRSIIELKKGYRNIRKFDINWKKPVLKNKNDWPDNKASGKWPDNKARSGPTIRPDLARKSGQVKDNTKRNNKKDNMVVPLAQSHKGRKLMLLPGLSKESNKSKKIGLSLIVLPQGERSGKPPKIGGSTDCELLYDYVKSDFNDWDKMGAGDIARLVIGMFNHKKWKHNFTYKVLSAKLKFYVQGHLDTVVPALIDVYENPSRYKTKKCIGYLFDGGEDYGANPLAILAATNVQRVVGAYLEKKQVKMKTKTADQNVISYIVKNLNIKYPDYDSKHAVSFYLDIILNLLHRAGELDKYKDIIMEDPYRGLKSLDKKYLKGQEKVFDYVKKVS